MSRAVVHFRCVSVAKYPHVNHQQGDTHYRSAQAPAIDIPLRNTHCFSYGWPSAAGGVARPTTPVRTIIVRMYGSICGSCEGMSGRKILMVDCTDEPSPKIKAP